MEKQLAINPTFVTVIALLLVFSLSFEICDASGSGRRRWRPSSTTLTNSSMKKKSKSHGSKSNHHRNNNGGSKHPKAPFHHKSPPLPPPSPKPPVKGAPPKKNPIVRPPHKGGSSAAFNVLNFGAKGDGSTDDTKAFEAAWTAACKLEASTMIIPEEYEFLVGPISFSGPHCAANIVFKLDGTIMAPTDSKVWGKGLLQWLEFTKLKGITVMGKGTIDGRGSVWWEASPYNDESDLVVTSNAVNNPPITVGSELSMKMPSIKPTALRFYGSYNVTVTGIKIENSQKCHLKFDNCMGVLVHDMTVSSPGDSPNTDGIHLQNSKDVLIYRTDLACGDDCISIQTGCSNVYVHNVKCGPGHGISIGGLGKDNTKACVSNITVRDVTMHNTMNGVRIKTWQGGSGCVQGIMFSDIQVSEVEVPIVIDQFYCDKTKCKNQTSAVSLSGITYQRIRGTYTVKPLHLACSDSLPCIDLTLNTIQLKPAIQNRGRYHLNNIPFCWHTFGELTTSTVPPIDCLQIGKPSSKRVQSDHDIC